MTGCNGDGEVKRTFLLGIRELHRGEVGVWMCLVLRSKREGHCVNAEGLTIPVSRQ